MNQGRTVAYPTWHGVGLMAAGGPVAVLLSVLRGPGWWVLAPLWIAVAALAIAGDALLAPSRRVMRAEVAAPDRLEAGGPAGDVAVGFPRAPPAARVELALEAGALLAIAPARLGVDTAGGGVFSANPMRRGRTLLQALHLRWRGPLGLAWLGHVQRLDRPIDVIPNVSAVREEAMRLFSRNRDAGTAVQRDLSASLEFHALREFRAGDDGRTINWRQSARHRTLLVRETQAERNRSIVVAIDTGRLMSEPLDGGLPRIDHAINAALLLAFAGLQRRAAALDYATQETNFTLGLSVLGSNLPGRTLVVIFTEFADATGAALMIDSLGPLLERHLVVFVAFRDAELDDLVRAAPEAPADVSRAVVAGGLLRERDLVLHRLRRLGVDVLDAPAAAAGPALLRRYLALKRDDRL